MGEIPNYRRAKYGFADDSIPSFNLPNDISMYVFSKLPVNSILRCRCVCKQWQRLLSDPEFFTMHLNHSLNRQKFILKSGLKSYYLVDYEPNKGNCDTLRRDFLLGTRNRDVLLGTCNGLLCFGINHVKEGHKIVLWNPSIGDYKMLPDPNPPVIDTSDLFNYSQLIGFGYDSFFRDYKLVRVLFCPQFRVDVYSLKTNSWKVIKSAPLSRFDYSRFDGGMTVNGSIYWLVYRESGQFDRWLVCFDLKDDKLVELRLPPLELPGLCLSENLREMGGRLLLYCYYWNDDESETFVILWMMKEDKKDEWTKTTSISCHESGRICWYLVHTNPLCGLENGKDLFYIAASDDKTESVELLIYDPKLNSILEIVSFYGIGHLRKLVKYTESLVSPNAWVA